MLNEMNENNLFCDYYEQWVAVYKEGAVRPVTWEIVKRTNACLMEDPYWLRFSEDETFEDTTRGRARRIMNENQKSS